MPVTYRLDSDVLYLTAVGHYPMDEIPRQFLAGLADPACPSTVGLLLDVRDSEVLGTRNPEQIRYTAEFLKPYADRIGHRAAVVVTRDAHFGLARMGSVFADNVGIEIQVFRSSEDAVTWLHASKIPRPR